MQSYKGVFGTFVDIQGSDGADIPSEIQVVPTGEFNTLKYGKFKITDEHLDQMVANFKASTRKAVPIDVDHDGGKAAGWVKDLVRKGNDGLFAVVKWTAYGKQLLGDEIYKLFSPEFSLGYVDPEYSTDHHGSVFIAGSLVNRPLFKELKPIMASETPLTNGSGVVLLLGQETMNLEEIKTKTKEELTPEEVTFLKEHSVELSEEEKTKFDLVEKPADEKKKENEAETKQESKTEETKVKETNIEAVKTETNVEASKTSTIKASELAELRILAEEGRKAKEALVAKEADETISAFVCSDKGGVILPKDKEATTKFYLSCNDAQKIEFKKILQAIPDRMIAGEIGNGEESEKNAIDKFNEAVNKLAAEKKISIFRASEEVRKSNPSLYDAAKAENKGE